MSVVGTRQGLRRVTDLVTKPQVVDLRRGLISLALIALVVLNPQVAAAWGNEGHTAINRVAAEKIPAAMPRFLRRAALEIAYLGPEPDRWRSPSEFALKNSQEPDHFIDLERVAWLDPLPPGRYEFYRKLYEKRASTSDHPDDYLPERVGLQPYITMEVYGRLKAHSANTGSDWRRISPHTRFSKRSSSTRDGSATTSQMDHNRCTPRFSTTAGSAQISTGIPLSTRSTPSLRPPTSQRTSAPKILPDS